MIRNKLVSKSYAETGTRVTFTPEGMEGINVEANQFSPEIVNRLLQYGIGQKIGDSYALGVKNGNPTPQMAADEINAMVAQLAAGDWKAIREGGGAPSGGKRVRVLFELGESGLGDITAKQFKKLIGGKLNVTEWTLENVRTAFAGATDKMKKDLYGSQQFLDKARELEDRDGTNAKADMFA